MTNYPGLHALRGISSYSGSFRVFLLLNSGTQMHYSFCCWCWPSASRRRSVPGPPRPQPPPRWVRKLSASLIVCINWRLESRLRGTRTKGTTLSFRSTATCNCCNSPNRHQPLVRVPVGTPSQSDSPENVVPVRLFTLGRRSMRMELAGLLQDTSLRPELAQDLLLGHQHVQGSVRVVGWRQEAQGSTSIT